MTATYNMQALENYDATNKALVDGGLVNTPPYNQLSNADNQVVGTAIDRVRGKIMYVTFNAISTDGNLGDYFNLTGFTLWDGFNAYPPGGSLNFYNNLSPFIGEKDINTDGVKWYNTYDPTKLVPTTVSPVSGFGTGVYSIKLLTGGSGYTHASVVFSGGSGSTPTATAGTGAKNITSSFWPNSNQVSSFYWAILPSGQAFQPSAHVSQSAYPYTDGSYSVSFRDSNGGGPYFNIGPISYTALISTAGGGNPPIVSLTNFGLASGGVTYSIFLLSAPIYEVDITQVFPGQVTNLTLGSHGTGTGWTMSITGDGTGATGVAYNNTGISTPGTWRRIGRDYAPSGGGNNPVIVNPRNSDLFVHAESCELYQYRFRDNFAQVISPYIYLSVNNPANSPMVRMFGLDGTWTYSIVTAQTPPGQMIALVIIPTSITSDEVTYDSKLAYAVYTAPAFIGDLGVRTVLGTDDALYLLSLYGDADNELTYRLTRFTPPPFSAYIPGSNIAGGTFTDVTPWSATTGPNSDGENYTTSTVPKPSWFSYISFLRLPAVMNEAVGICKFLKEQSASPTDYTKTLISCVNLKLGSSPSFDYHSGFVTGYMTTAWVSVGSIPVTGYAVLNYRELDVDYEQTDVVDFQTDYTKRWLYFDVYPIAGSTVVTSGGPKVVMVQYQFAYGQAPAVLQVIPEDGWDTTYAAYGTAIGKTFVVENSLYQDQTISDVGYIGLMRDVGITLGTNALPVWWWSGQVDNQQDTASNNMFLLNPAFSARAALNPPTTSTSNIIAPIDAPFLRLAFAPNGSSLAPWPISGGGGGGGGTGSTWATRVRKWLRSWRAHPQANVHSQRYNVLEVDMEPGVAPAGSNPQIVLRYTDDSHTWSSEHYAAGGPAGDYGQRIRFRRLGMERRGLSSDRVFELSGTDTAKIILLGADVS